MLRAQSSRVPHPANVSIEWYRTKLPKGVSEKIHRKSDFRAALQTVGWLANLALWFVLALRVHSAFALLYCMQVNFAINAMHELGHRTVFKTKVLNDVFLRVVSFLGWLHPDMFFSSHLRHHRYTLNEPYDQENPMPTQLTLRSFLSFGFVNVNWFVETITQTIKAALGIYPTGHLGWKPQWEAICYPSSLPAARAPAMRWAQLLLIGHISVAVAASQRGWSPLIPAMVSVGPFLNGWLFWLCNSTQHICLEYGTAANGKMISDFRRTTRSFTLHPFLAFWYWHMNWHTEHHMYAAVPCYNLETLHNAIRYDLPPTPNGIVATWRVIAREMRLLRRNPLHFQRLEIPGTNAGAGANYRASTRRE